jgi:hypothetical protein
LSEIKLIEKLILMDRRELLKMIALLTGGAVIGGDFLIAGCKNPEARSTMSFSEGDIAFLDEVGETILPATKTPGAKAAHIGEFMKTIVNDCYEESDQTSFHEGINKLNDACDKKFGHSFMKATPQQRHALLIDLDKEAKDYQKQRSEKNKAAREKDKNSPAGQPGPKALPNHYFTLMKQLTLWGYFTSKEGMTEALRFTPVPGKYEGCIDYKKGDRMFVGLG